jgi:hypothetical protein
MLLALALAAAGLVGCRNSSGIDYTCPDVANPGIAIAVVDSATQAVVGRNASIVARSAAFTDSVPAMYSAVSDGPFGLVYSQTATGTYTVTVKQSGYRDWVRTGIVVTKANACSLRTVNVTAQLQK